LQGRLILLVFMALLPLLILVLYQLWDAHRLRTAAAHQQASALAVSLGLHHAAQINAAGRIMDALAAAPDVTHGSAAECRSLLAAVAAEGQTFVNLARTTPDGAITCSANASITELPAAGRATLQRSLIRRALTTGEVHIGGPRDDAMPIMPMALPLTGPEAERPSVLVGGMLLDWFEALRITPGALPPSTVVVLTNLSDTIIAAVPSLPGLGPTLSRQPASDDQPEVWNGLFQGDVSRVVASTATADGLRIIVAIAREATDGVARNDLLVALAASVVALLLALLAGHGIARFLVLDPLGPLRAATERLAKGEFAGRIGPPYRGPAEMVKLAQAFDAMADRIAERELDLINSETKLLVKRQSEERYRTLVERAPEAIVLIVDEHVVFANRQAAEVLNAPEVDDLIGTPLDILLEPSDPLLTLLAASPVDNEPPRLAETRLHRLRGTAFWAEAALAPVDYGGRSAWHVVVRDVSGRKEVERKLAQASKLATLGEVAAGLAHELSQPMNVIRVAAEAATLEDRAESLPPSTREHLALIADQAARVGEIIDHVRVFSRPEPGERAIFDAFATARRAASFLEQQNRDDGITLDLWFDSPQGMVDGVAVHVEQVVLNLLANARQSLRRDHDFNTGRRGAGWRPRITLTGRVLEGLAGERRVLLTVSDNGGALNVDELAHAFDPFFTARNGGSNNCSHGRGLGLSICYALATALGGTLSVHNEGDGQHANAVFTLSLPSAHPESAINEPNLCPESRPARNVGDHA